MINYYTYETKLGTITLIASDTSLIKVTFDRLLTTNMLFKETPLIKEAKKQLDDYLAGKIESFNLPLAFKGTIFQEKVMAELVKIPYGEVISYQELARRCGNIKATRAIGRALNQNPLPIFYPCHRVIGKNKKLVGYRYNLKRKEELLALERKYKEKHTIIRKDQL